MANLIMVEDEIEILLIMSEIIEENGHTVRHAKNALQALEMLRAEWADVIISDIIIPLYNLDFLLQGLREFEKRPKLLIFSGAPDEVLRRYESYPILRKPDGFRDLAAKVNELLTQ